MVIVANLRDLARRLIPFRLRRELVILKRLPQFLIERPKIAKARTDEPATFEYLLASHSSPLERTPGAVSSDLQRGKEINVGRAAELLDGLVIGPNQTFSHHHAIGRTTHRRGFRKGMELQNGDATGSWGGGLCQVSNSFYWVAVRSGMRITERHRHGLDLFPDHERTVPFGCGATVVYNYADFRFENPYPEPVMMRARIGDGSFVSEIWATSDPGVHIEVEETDHRFFEGEEGWMRENRLRRRITDTNGELISDVEVAHNVGRVMYEPPEGSQ